MSESTIRRAFGLDLSGFSSGASALACVAETAGSLSAAIIEGHPFAQKVDGTKPVQDRIDAETNLVREVMDIAPLAVDIPIDLQQLDSRDEPEFVWQMTRRTVDKAYGALAPLADRIGAPVARFRAIHRRLEGKTFPEHLLETYPSAALRYCLGVEWCKGYKGKAIYVGESWRGESENAEDGKDNKLGSLLRKLNWSPDDNESKTLTNDEVDAIICATAALTPLSDTALRDNVEAAFAGELPKDWTLPRGYVLPMSLPKGIRISKHRIPTDGTAKWLKDLEPIE